MSNNTSQHEYANLEPVYTNNGKEKVNFKFTWGGWCKICSRGDCNSDWNNLRFLNLVAGLVHLASGIALLVLTFIDGNWEKQLLTLSNTIVVGRPGPNSTIDCTNGIEFPAILLSAIFALITAGFHFFTAISKTRYGKILRKKSNYIRWIEYSITASLMIIIVGTLSGVVDLYANIANFAATVAMIMFGHSSDNFLRRNHRREAIIEFLKGSIVGFAPWINIFTAFGQSITQSPTDVPWFVYSIPLVLFFNWSSFGINQALYIKYDNFKRAEAIYVILSLVAKLSLEWQAVGALLFS